MGAAAPNENKAVFLAPAKVQVSHILFRMNDNINPDFKNLQYTGIQKLLNTLQTT